MIDPVKRTNFLRRWSVPIFLLIVASFHMARVHAYNQSSWGAGCGFGMFAKVDYHDTRFFRCVVTTIDRQNLSAYFRPALKQDDLKARVVPTAFNLSALANRLSEQQWYEVAIYDDSETTRLLEMVASTDPQAKEYINARYPDANTFVRPQPVEIETIKLELFGMRFDLNQQAINSYLLSDVVLQRNLETSLDVALN